MTSLNAAAGEAPYDSATPVTPSDTVDLAAVSRALFVGATGAVKVKMRDGNDATFGVVPGGTTIKIRVRRVYATGTTATGVVALR